jgi:hypothetical protein
MRPPDRKRFNLFHLSIAVAASAVFMATFRGPGVKTLDVALFLGIGLFPILVTIVFPYNPHVEAYFGPQDPDPNLLRGLCCSSAELVMLQMIAWRMEAAEQPSRSITLIYSTEINIFVSALLIALWIGTHVAIYTQGYDRKWHWLFLWHLLMWSNFELWVYLHSV